MPPIDIGEKAPHFTLHDQDGKSHSLKDYSGHIIIMYFYPKDDTASDTALACHFRDYLPDFQKIKVEVLGVSPGTDASHQQFAAKHRLTFKLLVDVPGHDGVPRVASDYGVWFERQVYGTKQSGVARTTYLIDSEGKVARRWDNAKVPGHVLEVLAAAKVLHSGGKLVDPDGELKPIGNVKPPKQKHRVGGSPSFQPVRGPGGGHGPGGPAKRSAATQRKPSSPG